VKLAVAMATAAALSSGCGSIPWESPEPRDILKRSGFAWLSTHTEHFCVHVIRGSTAERDLVNREEDAERSFARALELLGESSYAATIDVFIVESRAIMRRLVGAETNGRAFPEANMLAYVYGGGINAGGPHELTHVIANNLWGPGEPWLSEGLAVYADDRWHDHHLHALAKHLVERGDLPAFETLVNWFRWRNSLLTYPAAGSLVKHLYERYGLDAVKAAWGGGAAALPEVTGKSREALEREWHSVIRAADASGLVYRALENR